MLYAAERAVERCIVLVGLLDLRTTYGQGDVAGRGSSDLCLVWDTQVYGQLRPLKQVQRVPPQSLVEVLPVWHVTHPTKKTRIRIKYQFMSAEKLESAYFAGTGYCDAKWENTHLVSKGLEFTGGAGIEVHKLVSIYE